MKHAFVCLSILAGLGCKEKDPPPQPGSSTNTESSSAEHSTRSQERLPQHDFKRTLQEMMNAATDQFKSLLGEPNPVTDKFGTPRDWNSTKKLPGAEKAFIWFPAEGVPKARLSNLMFRGEVAPATPVYNAFVKQVRACLSAAWASKETSVDEGDDSNRITTFKCEGVLSPTSISVALFIQGDTAEVYIGLNDR